MRGVLVLEDGTTFEGRQFGRGEPRGCEVVCVTGLNWPEVLSCPAYSGQIVAALDLPAAPEDISDGARGFPSGLLLNGTPAQGAHAAGWRLGVAGMAGVDLKALAAHLRRTGPLAGSFMAVAVERAGSKSESMAVPAGRTGPVLPQTVSTRRPYRIYGGGAHALVYDYGVSDDLLSWLVGQDLRTTVVPWDYPAEDVLEMVPDVVVLSGGPGNPAECASLAEVFSPLLGQLPLLGVGLGHQLLARSVGGRTGPMWVGHRGRRCDVREIDSGETCATVQSHGYAVLNAPPGSRVTHTCVQDGSIEGLEYPALRAASTQFGPGPGQLAAPLSRVWERLLGPAAASIV